MVGSEQASFGGAGGGRTRADVSDDLSGTLGKGGILSGVGGGNHTGSGGSDGSSEGGLGVGHQPGTVSAERVRSVDGRVRLEGAVGADRARLDQIISNGAVVAAVQILDRPA